MICNNFDDSWIQDHEVIILANLNSDGHHNEEVYVFQCLLQEVT